jgi:MFS transporter, NNP family, nitrate/nitrite transporter
VACLQSSKPAFGAIPQREPHQVDPPALVIPRLSLFKMVDSANAHGAHDGGEYDHAKKHPVYSYTVETKAEENGPQPIFTLRRPVVDENYRAKSLQMLSVARPHARAFHYSWFSFFVAFCGWFALAPLLQRIKKNNPKWLNKNSLYVSNVVAVCGTFIMRLIIGPFCDRFGPRLAMGSVLMIFSVPVGLVGLAHSYAAFTSARFFIGFVGAAFVIVQFWTSMMYSGPVVGTANAVSAGWGNLGGGFVNAIMPVIVSGIQSRGVTSDNAWRYAQIIPALALFFTGLAAFFIVDDDPQGNYADLHKAGTKTKTNPYVSLLRACKNYRVWVLFLAYGACFGVEVLMNLNLATYVESYFKTSEKTAGLVGGIVGLVNLFARAVGGYLSDLTAKKIGMRGRVWTLFSVLVLEGIFLVLFSRMNSFPIAVVMVSIFAIFVDMGAGATYGVVPFVDAEATGAVCGVVGAGGNFGSIVAGVALRLWGAHNGFMYVGFGVLAVALCMPLLHWSEHGSMFFPKAKIQGNVVLDDE